MKHFRPLRPFSLAAVLVLASVPLFAAEVAPADAGRAAKAWVDRGYAMGKLPAGRTVADVDEIEDPATGAIAGLSFTSAGYLGWNGTRWVALSGAAPTGAPTAWTATFDFTASPAKVRYAAGGTVLTADGQAWIPLATSRSFVSGVGYRGGGSVGDFRAVKSGGLDVPVLASPALDGVEPLELSGFAIALRINNAACGAWYTVYASETVDGTYRAVKSVSATSDGVFAIGDVPAGGDTLFLRVGVSDASVPVGTAAP